MSRFISGAALFALALPAFAQDDLAAYKKACLAYLEEVRIAANLTGLSPSLAEYQKQVAKARELLVRLPEPPKSHQKVHKVLPVLHDSLKDGGRLLALAIQAANIGQEEAAKQALASFQETGEKTKEIVKMLVKTYSK